MQKMSLSEGGLSAFIYKYKYFIIYLYLVMCNIIVAINIVHIYYCNLNI